MKKDWSAVKLVGPATDKQKDLMRKLGIEFGANITKAGASAKIGSKLEAMKSQPKQKFVRHYAYVDDGNGQVYDEDENYNDVYLEDDYEGGHGPNGTW